MLARGSWCLGEQRAELSWCPNESIGAGTAKLILAADAPKDSDRWDAVRVGGDDVVLAIPDHHGVSAGRQRE
jgi:hypothetical protein